MRKKLLIGLLVVGLLGLIAVGVGYWIVMTPNTGSYPEGVEARGVQIPQGATFAQALDSLEARGVLGNRQTFAWMARATGWCDQIKAGHYRIAEGASNYDMLQKLRRGLQDPVRLTIPPGTRPEVVAAVAARDMAFSKEDFLAALRDTALAADLGTDGIRVNAISAGPIVLRAKTFAIVSGSRCLKVRSGPVPSASVRMPVATITISGGSSLMASAAARIVSSSVRSKAKGRNDPPDGPVPPRDPA